MERIESSIDIAIKETLDRIADESERTDSYDSSYLDYLEEAKSTLMRDGENGLLSFLKGDLPRLEKSEREEEAQRRFDWYDDHYYEKIAMGRKDACNFILGLFDR